MSRSSIKHSITCALFGLGCFVATPFAHAYTFNDACAPETVHSVTVNAPRATIILDRSGSMNWPGNATQSRLEIAQEVLDEFAQLMKNPGPCPPQSTCDVMQLGLGWFSGLSATSAIDVTAGEDTYSDFSSTLFGYTPNGTTRLDYAAQELLNESALNNNTRNNLGIIVTDGAPSAGVIIDQMTDPLPAQTYASVERLIYLLCAARDRTPNSLPIYFMGFSSGTNEGLNNLFAAAGGTGECCQGSGCDATVDANGRYVFPMGQIYDPCAAPSVGMERLDISDSVDGFGNSNWLNDRLDDDLTCQGAFQADSGNELKDDLLSIVDDARCVFPLDVPAGYPEPGALADPAATRVTLTHTNWAPDPSDPIVVPHLSEGAGVLRARLIARGVVSTDALPFEDDGWEFAGAARTKIRLTRDLCALAKQPETQRVTTQLACPCPDEGDACEVGCDPTDGSGIACELDAGGAPIRAGRCRHGEVACVEQSGAFVEVCQPLFTPQPEICNGLDDDCDARVDNLERALPAAGLAYEWDGDEAPLAARALSVSQLFCEFESVCACGADGPEELGPAPGPGDDEWHMLLDAYTGRCACTEGLSPAAHEPATAFAPSLDEPSSGQRAAACASLQPATPSAPRLPWMLGLAVAALIGARRRRTRR